MISLSVSLSGSILAPLVTEDLVEVGAELALSHAQEDLAFTGMRMRPASAGCIETASGLRQVNGTLQLFGG